MAVVIANVTIDPEGLEEVVKTLEDASRRMALVREALDVLKGVKIQKDTEHYSSVRIQQNRSRIASVIVNLQEALKTDEVT